MARTRLSLRARADAMLTATHLRRSVASAVSMTSPANRGLHWVPPALRANEDISPIPRHSCSHRILLTLPCGRCRRSVAQARSNARKRGETVLV
jgi:hypothetical protein